MEANAAMRAHDRMPVILAAEVARRWLAPGPLPGELLLCRLRKNPRSWRTGMNGGERHVPRPPNCWVSRNAASALNPTCGLTNSFFRSLLDNGYEGKIQPVPTGERQQGSHRQPESVPVLHVSGEMSLAKGRCRPFPAHPSGRLGVPARRPPPPQAAAIRAPRVPPLFWWRG